MDLPYFSLFVWGYRALYILCHNERSFHRNYFYRILLYSLTASANWPAEQQKYIPSKDILFFVYVFYEIYGLTKIIFRNKIAFWLCGHFIYFIIPIDTTAYNFLVREFHVTFNDIALLVIRMFGVHWCHL